MRRRRPIDAATEASRFPYRLGSVFALTLLLGMTSAAQQPTVNKQKAPRLTTDDVVRPPVSPPVQAKETEAKSEEGKAGAVDSKAGQPKATETKASSEESSWRDQVTKARDRAKELQRAAEEAELRITTLRNNLGVSGQSARYRNDTAAELDQAGQQLATMRTQARAAADDLTQLVDYGRQNGFAEAAEPTPTDEGKPNEQYYRTQFAKLTEALDGAQRRIQLYDNRVRDLNQQITTNSGGKDKTGHRTGGDGYFAAQLQKDRDEAQQKLDEARTALTKAQTDLDALKDEARRAGAPPGLFR
jgi:chromosome segregation ATPase